jgi:outer membrane protein TolC
MRRTLLLPALTAIAVFLAGCSVKVSPLTAQEHRQRAETDMQALYKKQEPISGPITLHEAIARALKYNYDHRLAVMEATLQDTQLSLATVNMLPKLVANAGYWHRSNELASSSESVASRKQSLEPSTSLDNTRGIADLSFTWNLLDFGVSYFQAKQQADRILVAQERRHRVINNIVKEVMAAYWNAAIADQVLPRVSKVLAEAEQALKASWQIESKAIDSLMKGLEYQKSLLLIVDQLQKLQADLGMSKVKLKALINAPMGSQLTLEMPMGGESKSPALAVSVGQLEAFGLVQRPDLREEAYQERISRNDMYKEILKIFPGLSIPISGNFDSNSFLVNQMWAETAVRTSLNLINVLAAPRIWKSAETQIEVARIRRMAMSVAALVQINVGYQQYQRAVVSYENAKAILRVEGNLLTVIAAQAAVAGQSELERIRHQTSALAAELQSQRNLADVYAALGNIYASIGLEPYDGPVDDVPVATLSVAVKETLDRWRTGSLPEVMKVQPIPYTPEDAPGGAAAVAVAQASTGAGGAGHAETGAVARGAVSKAATGTVPRGVATKIAAATERGAERSDSGAPPKPHQGGSAHGASTKVGIRGGLQGTHTPGVALKTEQRKKDEFLFQLLRSVPAKGTLSPDGQRPAATPPKAEDKTTSLVSTMKK